MVVGGSPQFAISAGSINMSSKTQSKLTIETTESGLRAIVLPEIVQLTHAQTAAAWNYFLGGFSSACVKNSWESGPDVRRSLTPERIIELLESAAKFARKHG